MYAPHISSGKLADLVKEARSREGAHVMRQYTLELGQSGILLRVADRSTNHTYCVDRVMQYDALSFPGMDYALCIFNLADDIVAAGLDSLKQAGSREAA